MAKHTLPDDFIWGVATSAHQIEGATEADGRGESIWERFASTPGNIKDGTDARVACEHYTRWEDDVELLRWLGVGAYRFSIAWPRILPDGRGRVNDAGLDFYDKLVDRLLETGIRPFVTLYHWDLPQTLQDQGGWTARETAEAFASYSSVVADRLGDRVKDWVTHNEPWCIAMLGHNYGQHAPGHEDPVEARCVAHHLLLSHGWSVEAIRAKVREASVGIVLNLVPTTAASNSDADRDAARAFDGSFNRWYLDPLYRGKYPEDVIVDGLRFGFLESKNPSYIHPGDLETIATPTDFLGINYYSRAVIKAGENGEPAEVKAPEDTLTDMGWEVFPDGLGDILSRVHRDYAPPKLYVTENGAAFQDAVNEEGRVPDARRVAYLQDHVASATRVIDAGVPLHGYFAWSLMDNFEWGFGFAKRFGLFHVDYETQKRTPKESAFWYRDMIAKARSALPV